MLPAASTLEEITRVLTLCGALRRREMEKPHSCGVQGRLGQGLGADPAAPGPGQLRLDPTAPTQRPSAPGVHGTRMALLFEGDSWRVWCADGEGGKLSSSIQDGPRALEKLSHGLVRAPPSPVPPPPPLPGAPRSGPCGIVSRGLGRVPASPTLLPCAHVRE